MATLSQGRPVTAMTDEDPAEQIARILEEHFDEMGWSEEERNQRVASASTTIDAAVARAKLAFKMIWKRGWSGPIR